MKDIRQLNPSLWRVVYHERPHWPNTPLEAVPHFWIAQSVLQLARIRGPEGLPSGGCLHVTKTMPA